MNVLCKVNAQLQEIALPKSGSQEDFMTIQKELLFTFCNLITSSDTELLNEKVFMAQQATSREIIRIFVRVLELFEAFNNAEVIRNIMYALHTMFNN